MLLCALLAMGQGSLADLTTKLDALAQARDLDGLSAYLAPYKGRNPLSPIKTNGAYDTGRFGWHAILMRMLQDNFIVFTTPLTSEDVGELLFRFGPDGKLQYIPEDETNGEKLISHDFNIRFDLAGKKAIVKDKVLYRVVGQQYLPPMLRIGPNYRVSHVTNEQGKDVPFLQAGGIICFPGLYTNETLNLTYTGTLDKPKFAGSISDKEVMLTNDYWYPMVARQPVPYTLTVTVPQGWIAVGQGERVSEAGDKVTFKMDVPVTYYSFSAAPYATAAHEANGRKYRVWSNTMSKASMDLQNELYPSIIDLFSDQFWPYPFSQWGAVVSSAYGSGALEAYSFATYGGGMPGADPHETAHSWFGGMIDNTYLHSMWNESFAVFCEGFYRRNVPIGNVDERRLAFIDTPQTSSAFNAAPPETASPFIGPAANGIGYGKGAYVLQMLEQEIGTDRFLKSVREWHRVRPPDQGSEWPEFERAVDRMTGNDEQWFFGQWLRRTGWADFDVQNVKWSNGQIVGETVFKSEPYVLHAEVMIRDEAGHDSFVTAILSNNANVKTQRFTIPCQTKPALLSVDPWRRILRPIHPDEAPVELQGALLHAKRYSDPKQPGYLNGISTPNTLTDFPRDLENAFIVGNPQTLPQMRDLCAKAGFEVKGELLTWKGTTIDLRHGAALAVVDLPGGKRCVIGLGHTRMPVGFDSYGRARTVLVDDLGRFIRGWTEPKTSGFLTFRGF